MLSLTTLLLCLRTGLAQAQIQAMPDQLAGTFRLVSGRNCNTALVNRGCSGGSSESAGKVPAARSTVLWPGVQGEHLDTQFCHGPSELGGRRPRPGACGLARRRAAGIEGGAPRFCISRKQLGCLHDRRPRAGRRHRQQQRERGGRPGDRAGSACPLGASAGDAGNGAVRGLLRPVVSGFVGHMPSRSASSSLSRVGSLVSPCWPSKSTSAIPPRIWRLMRGRTRPRWPCAQGGFLPPGRHQHGGVC